MYQKGEDPAGAPQTTLQRASQRLCKVCYPAFHPCQHFLDRDDVQGKKISHGNASSANLGQFLFTAGVAAEFGDFRAGTVPFGPDKPTNPALCSTITADSAPFFMPFFDKRRVGFRHSCRTARWADLLDGEDSQTAFGANSVLIHY